MDTGNGEKLELQMERIAHRVVKEYIPAMEKKLDVIMGGVTDLKVCVGSLKTDVQNIKDTVKENRDARTGQLTWFQRTVTGAIWVAVITGAVTLVYKLAQAFTGVAQGG
jgi:hypothetical protein